MYGVDMGDSMSLAQAYEMLQSWRVCYPTDFAHACYHYGRLLREKENPAEAMQVFINATHSHTRDYAILGRIYNNMGDIAHLAGEFDLSYEMFKRSGKMYLKNGDTTAYYYILNDMAFELAEQGKKEDAYALIRTIENGIRDSALLTISIATRAVACKKVTQYDSVIYYTSQVLANGYYDPSVLLVRAQAYSFLGKKDSAVYYAQIVLRKSNRLSHINNALYILTNDVDTKDVEPIRQTASDRSDTQKLLAIRQGKLSQAVQLLQQDTIRKPNLNWLYTLLSTLFIVGCILFVYIHKKQKAHQLLSQKIEALKSEDATNLALRKKQVEEKCALFANSPTIKVDLYWNNYVMLCKCVDTHFFMLAEKLKQKHIFNEQEVRLCVLVLLNMSRNQIADILPYAQNGVGKLKYRVSKKLHIEGKNLQKYLICIATDEPYQ